MKENHDIENTARAKTAGAPPVWPLTGSIPSPAVPAFSRVLWLSQPTPYQVTAIFGRAVPGVSRPLPTRASTERVSPLTRTGKPHSGYTAYAPGTRP